MLDGVASLAFLAAGIAFFLVLSFFLIFSVFFFF